MKSISALLLSPLTLAALLAQTPPMSPDRFVYWPAGELSAYNARLKAKEPLKTQGRVNRIGLEHFELHPNYSFYQVRRDEDGFPELHDRWHDLFIIHEGGATVMYGGTAEGIATNPNTPKEHIGGRIAGGKSQHLSAGDMCIIPAGIPHQVNPDSGGVFYMIVKIDKSSEAPGKGMVADRFVYWPASELDAYRTSLKAKMPMKQAGEDVPAGMEHFELHPNYSFFEVRRDGKGLPELHQRWNDVFIVQQGSGEVIYGGKGEEMKVSAGPGESVGGHIVGGTRQHLAAGDMAIIPGGIPHQVNPDPGQSIFYMVLKIEHQ